MNKLKNIQWKNYINYIAIALVLVVFVALTLVGSVSASTTSLLEEMAIKIILAVSLSLVVGFLGELSLGHAGFMCVGAYIGGKVAAVLAAPLGNGILTLVIAIVVGAASAAICGFLVGLPALRLRGDYLAITTLAFGEIVRTIFMNTSENSFGGPVGLSTPRFDKKHFYIICLIMVLITLFVIQNLIRSKHGRAIEAIRDNEIAARATGINITNYKLLGFIMSAAFAGIAGVLYSYTKFNVSSQMFDYNYSIEILVIVVLGGMGSINGSIISAVAITFLNRYLANVLTGNLAVLKDLIYALILIFIVIYNNAPALKDFREKYNFQTLVAKLKRKKASKPDTDEAQVKEDA
ncbi:MAG: branched-chain amino acid ABC transporter permease [Ruminococcaceae bacterium]|nr:branched-chain amino acid ABC transporter permease [Oscillospiraceae bacterium]